MVAGDGPLRGWLEDRARQTPNLGLLGQLSAEALAGTLARASVALVPSLSYETFCYAAAEALLATRPVVAARIGAIPELVEHERTGLLTPPGDAEALAGATRRALTDPEARVWARAGHARVIERTDPAKHLARLLEVFGAAGPPAG